jgi:hypothetical protein
MPAKVPVTTQLHIRQWDDLVYNIQHRLIMSTAKEMSTYLKSKMGVEIDPEEMGMGLTIDHVNDDVSIVQYWFDLGKFQKSTPLAKKQFVAHEASHGTDMVMQCRGVPLCEETAEPRAYYLGAVVGALHSMIKEFTAKPRVKRKGA